MLPNPVVIEGLELGNFRRFALLRVTFEPDATVLVANNAGGKTAVLDALAAILGSFVGSFPDVKSPGFAKTDARADRVGAADTVEPQYPVTAAADMRLRGDLTRCERRVNFVGGRSTAAGPLKELARELQQELQSGAPVDLPLIAHFGTGRLWRQQSKSELRRPGTSRTAGYVECLSSGSSSKNIERWIRWATIANLQRRAANDEASPTARTLLETVEHAVANVVRVDGEDGRGGLAAHNIRWDIDDDALVAEFHEAEDGKRLPVASLSDGVRGIFGLVAELAVRAAVLNPHLGSDAAAQTPGIVLIDEIDLHLHPRWQQQIVPTLVSAFPCVQWTLTTHSPQVLSTVEGRQVRVLDQSWLGAGAAERGQVPYAKGRESSELLQHVQGVSPRPEGLSGVRALREFQRVAGRPDADPAELVALQQRFAADLEDAESDPEVLEATVLRRFMKNRDFG